MTFVTTPPHMKLFRIVLLFCLPALLHVSETFDMIRFQARQAESKAPRNMGFMYDVATDFGLSGT
jgi:hypothetical protein